MKKQNVLSGILLIGLGLYFVIKEFSFIHNDYLRWPVLFIIIGIALLSQYFKTKEYALLFPSTIILLLGIHFYSDFLVEAWPSHWAIYPFIISIGYFILFQRTKTGFFPGLLFLTVAAIGFLYHNGTGTTDPYLYILNRYWATLFLIVGLINIIRKKSY
jgi:hypothetical protein